MTDDAGNPQVRLPEEIIDVIDAVKKERGYDTRREAARYIFRQAGYLD